MKPIFNPNQFMIQHIACGSPPTGIRWTSYVASMTVAHWDLSGILHAYTWWRHQMELFSALLAVCAVNSPVNSLYKGQWRGALTFSFTYAWINGWLNYRDAGDLRRHRSHYDVTVMIWHLHYLIKCLLQNCFPIYYVYELSLCCVNVVWCWPYYQPFTC